MLRFLDHRCSRVVARRRISLIGFCGTIERHPTAFGSFVDNGRMVDQRALSTARMLQLALSI
jgi:hypothetical protein